MQSVLEVGIVISKSTADKFKCSRFNGATESNPSDGSEEADVTQKGIQEIRSRLKEQLKKDLLETITCSGVV